MPSKMVWIVGRRMVPEFHLHCYNEESAKRWVDFILDDLNDIPVVKIERVII